MILILCERNDRDAHAIFSKRFRMITICWLARENVIRTDDFRVTHARALARFRYSAAWTSDEHSTNIRRTFDERQTVADESKLRRGTTTSGERDDRRDSWERNLHASDTISRAGCRITLEKSREIRSDGLPPSSLSVAGEKKKNATRRREKKSLFGNCKIDFPIRNVRRFDVIGVPPLPAPVSKCPLRERQQRQDR